MNNKLLNKLGSTIKTIGRRIDKRSPEILIACGIVGFVSTCVLVAKEAPKAKEKLEELHENLAESDDELSKSKIVWEEFKIVAPIYAPAVISGTVSIGCVLCSYKIGTKRAAALATAYELTQNKLLDYEKKVRETFGDAKADKVIHDIHQDKIFENPPSPEITGNGSEVMMTDGLSLFYDPIGGRYFRSSVDRVRKAEIEIREQLKYEYFVPLNELYYQLDLANTGAGDHIGFNVDDGIEIVFQSVVAPDMTPCLSMEFLAEPTSKKYDF